MQNLMNELTKLFQKDERIFANGKLLKNKLTELALKLGIPGTHHLIVPDIRRRLEHKLCLRQNERSRYKSRPKLPLKKINFDMKYMF